MDEQSITEISRREDCRYWMTVPTRWNDNDMLGHVNNVVYYSYFEAIVVRFLMEECGLDWLKSPYVPLAAETLCRFKRPIAFPEVVEVGMKIVKLGNTSVTYAIGLFVEGDENPVALGHFVHVYVDRETDRPSSIPDHIRSIYKNLM